MNASDDNIRVVIPLTIRRRNGRPKILPPENVTDQQTRAAGSAHSQGSWPGLGMAAAASRAVRSPRQGIWRSWRA